MEPTFYQKLIAVQNELKAPKNQVNKFGGFNYRSCEDILTAVKPLLTKNGLLLKLTDELVQIGDRYYVKAIAEITGRDKKKAVMGGDFEEARSIKVEALARETEDKKGMDGAQITGSASSYARKYALNGLFLIDDAKDADAQDPEE